MKTSYLKVEKSFPKSKAELWNAVALNFGGVHEYNPAIASSHLIGTQQSGVGTKRHCDFTKKGFISEEIIAWDEGNSFTLRFLESSFPMAHMQSKFSFIDHQNHSVLVQEFWFRMKGPMGIFGFLMKKPMKTTLVQGLEGLHQHLTQKK